MLHIAQTYKNGLKGHVSLPASKSISNRVLIINALTGCEIKINNLSKARDTKILKKLLIQIVNNISNEPLFLNCKDAGTAARFLTTYTALIGYGNYVISGTKRMQERPMRALVESLLKCGAKISTMKNEGHLPIQIRTAKNIKKKIHIDCSESSQYLSSVLLMAPSLKKGLKINYKNLNVSKPYVDMSIELMNYFGVHVEHLDNSYIIKSQDYKKRNIRIESDWSSAAYWYQMVSLENEAEVLLKGLKNSTIQGDVALIGIYKELGVMSYFTADGLILRKTVQELPSYFKYDFSDTPDIFPSVLLSCAFLNIAASFTGIKNLELKESKRISTLQEGLDKYGIKTTYEDDSLKLFKSNIKLNKKIVIQTYKDHRIAMSFACLAVKTGCVYLSEGHSVSKSYPDFWKQLENIGIAIKKL